MAFITNLLIAISLVAVVQAGYASSFAGSGVGNHQGNGYGSGYVFNPFTAAGFPGFPVFQFPQIHVATPDEIAKTKPGAGQNFKGTSVVSSSSMHTDADGNVVKDGKTTILTNDNGDVRTYSVGDDGNLEPVKSPPMPEYVMPEFPKMKPFKHHVFEPITFTPFVFEPIVFKPIKPIDPEDIRNHKTGENEHYVGTHVSSFSHSSNINGVKTSSVGSDRIVNNNGDVDESNIRVGQGDKTEEEMASEEHEHEDDHKNKQKHDNNHNNERKHDNNHNNERKQDNNHNNERKQDNNHNNERKQDNKHDNERKHNNDRNNEDENDNNKSNKNEHRRKHEHVDEEEDVEDED